MNGEFMSKIQFLCSLLMICIGLSLSQEKAGGRIHGLIVGDYFYKAGGDLQQYGDSSSQYSQPITKDFQGFQIRRLHLFYDYVISEQFFTRFQLEGNNKSLEPGGRQGLYVKTAYGEWRNIFPLSNLLLGLVPTPTWASVEGLWGYRSVEKTITDFRNLGSGSDMGVQLRGALSTSAALNYAFMIGNGNSQKPENNKYKKYYFLLSGSPFQYFSIETYIDHEPAASGKDRTTWKAFLSYTEEAWMAGAEIAEQVQHNQDTLQNNLAVFGISAFSWYRFSEQCKVFGRIDYYDPNRFSPGTGFYEYFLSFGIDYAPVKDIHFMPNIWINTFTDKSRAGRKKDADVVPRISFFFAFH
jgi:hypothetical protein